MVKYTVTFNMSLEELNEFKQHIACEGITPEIWFKRAGWAFTNGMLFNSGNTWQGRS